MTLTRNLTLSFLGVSLLTGCSFLEEYNYDDYSVYPYDVKNNYGVGYYEDQDYQGDYYHDDGIFHHHMQMERDFHRP